MSKSKHTPGKVEVVRDTIRYAGQRDRLNRMILGTPKNETGGRFVIATLEGPFAGTNAEADFHRLAACWNACEGINPEDVPKLVSACKTFWADAKTWRAMEHDREVRHAILAIGHIVEPGHVDCNTCNGIREIKAGPASEISQERDGWIPCPECR